MVRTSAPTGMGNKDLHSRHGVEPLQKIQTNLNDAKAGPAGPEIPELGTTLQTHDLNGKLVKESLYGKEDGNDDVAGVLEYNNK